MRPTKGKETTGPGFPSSPPEALLPATRFPVAVDLLASFLAVMPLKRLTTNSPFYSKCPSSFFGGGIIWFLWLKPPQCFCEVYFLIKRHHFAPEHPIAAVFSAGLICISASLQAQRRSQSHKEENRWEQKLQGDHAGSYREFRFTTAVLSWLISVHGRGGGTRGPSSYFIWPAKLE